MLLLASHTVFIDPISNPCIPDWLRLSLDYRKSTVRGVWHSHPQEAKLDPRSTAIKWSSEEY